MKERISHPTPLLFAFFALACGMALAAILPQCFIWHHLIAFFTFVFLTALLIIFIKEVNKPLLIGFSLISIFAFGAFRYTNSRQVRPEDVSNLVGMEVQLFGRVADEINREGDRQKFDLKADSVDLNGKIYPAYGKTRIYLYRAKQVCFNDCIALQCVLEEPKSASNPEAFDFKKSLSLKGIRTITFVRGDSKIKFVEKGKESLYGRVVDAICRHVETTIELGLDGDEAALLRGLLLGKGKELPQSVRSAFADSGTVHILAVSGLHVGIIAWILWFLLGTTFRMPRHLAAGICIIGLMIYAGVVGGRPSVLRASLMFSIILLGTVFRRPSNLLNSIGAAGTILLIIRPIWLFDIGFQLSFGATLAIAYLMPFFDEWIPSQGIRSGFIRKYIIGALTVSIAASIGTAPFIAFYFHRLQTISPLANLFVVPFVGIVVGYGILASLFSLFWKTGAIMFLAADKLVLKYLIYTASFFAGTKVSYLPFPKPPIFSVFIFFAVIVVVPLLLRKRIKGLLAVFVFLFAASCATFGMFTLSQTKTKSDLHVIFFDIGQGDCALIEFKDGRMLLVDGGLPGNASFSVRPFLESKGISRIDAALLTHPDSDHLGGLYDLLESFSYNSVFVPHRSLTNNLYKKFLQNLDSTGTEVLIVNAGDTLPGFPEINIIWPDSTVVSSSGSLLVNVNEASIVFELSLGEVQFLFTGDIGFPTESALRGALTDIDILKVPHHGSKYSTCDDFIASLTPVVSIISVGANRFGHPSPATISRLGQCGTDILRTDISGAVTIDVINDSIFCSTFDGKVIGYSGVDQPIPPL
ncbi:DNA internalization-related competence protein ComEC/Rec2 [bacterium]|nr:DNA internalization-related competence protein ComEC/Rec2 [bacterium]